MAAGPDDAGRVGVREHRRQRRLLRPLRLSAPDGRAIEGRPFEQEGHHEAGQTGGVETVLIDPRNPERFLELSYDGSGLLRFIAAALCALGVAGIALALSGLAG